MSDVRYEWGVRVWQWKRLEETFEHLLDWQCPICGVEQQYVFPDRYLKDEWDSQDKHASLHLMVRCKDFRCREDSVVEFPARLFDGSFSLDWHEPKDHVGLPIRSIPVDVTVLPTPEPDLMERYEEARRLWHEHRDALEAMHPVIKEFMAAFGGYWDDVEMNFEWVLENTPTMLEDRHRAAVEAKNRRAAHAMLEFAAERAMHREKACHGTLSCEQGRDCPSYQTCRRMACDKVSG